MEADHRNLQEVGTEWNAVPFVVSARGGVHGGGRTRLLPSAGVRYVERIRRGQQNARGPQRRDRAPAEGLWQPSFAGAAERDERARRSLCRAVAAVGQEVARGRSAAAVFRRHRTFCSTPRRPWSSLRGGLPRDTGGSRPAWLVRRRLREHATDDAARGYGTVHRPRGWAVVRL